MNFPFICLYRLPNEYGSLNPLSHILYGRGVKDSSSHCHLRMLEYPTPVVNPGGIINGLNAHKEKGSESNRILCTVCMQ